MFRLFLVTMVWTLVLSIPMTALAVLMLGVLTTNGIFLFEWVTAWGSQISYVGIANSAEIIGRMPEVYGMVAGMLVILITLWVAREPTSKSEPVQQRK